MVVCLYIWPCQGLQNHPRYTLPWLMGLATVLQWSCEISLLVYFVVFSLIIPATIVILYSYLFVFQVFNNFFFSIYISLTDTKSQVISITELYNSYFSKLILRFSSQNAEAIMSSSINPAFWHFTLEEGFSCQAIIASKFQQRKLWAWTYSKA